MSKIMLCSFCLVYVQDGAQDDCHLISSSKSGLEMTFHKINQEAYDSATISSDIVATNIFYVRY